MPLIQIYDNMQINNTTEQQGEVSVREMMLQIKGAMAYLRSKWILILLVIILGGAAGYLYAHLQPVRYLARQTFVMEESGGGGDGLASLAGQFGVDLSGGGGGSGGVFSGENVLVFLKSQNLVRETLLTVDTTKKATLVDQYAVAYGLKNKWENKDGLGTINYYTANGKTLSRVEDSLLQVLAGYIIDKELEVVRPNAKASFVEVKTTMRNEIISKQFCDRLVGLAIDKYVSAKIKVKSANVAMLQRRADSLEALLNARTYNAAASQQSLLDINPGLRVMTAAPEIRTREKSTALAVYAEVIKNLELAKTIMNQETPSIEVVDQSTIPLKKMQTSRVLAAFVLAFAFGTLCVLWLLIRRWWRLQK